MTTFEPYTAAFTGVLSTLTTKSGLIFTITKDHPRVTQGQPFMLEINAEQNRVRFLPVLMPYYWVGLR
jgi:hypothetical protein